MQDNTELEKDPKPKEDDDEEEEEDDDDDDDYYEDSDSDTDEDGLKNFDGEDGWDYACSDKTEKERVDILKSGKVELVMSESMRHTFADNFLDRAYVRKYRFIGDLPHKVCIFLSIAHN
jgi:hypothetical protein